MQITTVGHVVVYAILTTVLATLVPVVTLYLALSPIPYIPKNLLFAIMTIGAVIPLLIAMPLAIIWLHFIRTLNLTVIQVNNHVKFDGLTGVLSRNYFLDQVRMALPRGGVMLMIDADHFKSVNDQLGHDVGDKALKVIASGLKTASGPDAVVGRLGGEEFGVFVCGAGEPRARVVADAIREAVRRNGLLVAELDRPLTVSIGGVPHVRGIAIEQTMKAADLLLYEAKRTGRDRHVIRPSPMTPTQPIRPAA